MRIVSDHSIICAKIVRSFAAEAGRRRGLSEACAGAAHGGCDVASVSTRIKPSVESPKSGILVTEVITFDKIASWVILGRS